MNLFWSAYALFYSGLSFQAAQTKADWGSRLCIANPRRNILQSTFTSSLQYGLHSLQCETTLFGIWSEAHVCSRYVPTIVVDAESYGNEWTAWPIHFHLVSCNVKVNGEHTASPLLLYSTRIKDSDIPIGRCQSTSNPFVPPYQATYESLSHSTCALVSHFGDLHLLTRIRVKTRRQPLSRNSSRQGAHCFPASLIPITLTLLNSYCAGAEYGAKGAYVSRIIGHYGFTQHSALWNWERESIAPGRWPSLVGS